LQKDKTSLGALKIKILSKVVKIFWPTFITILLILITDLILKVPCVSTLREDRQYWRRSTTLKILKGSRRIERTKELKGDTWLCKNTK